MLLPLPLRRPGRTALRSLLAGSLLLTAALPALAQLPSFPGAEGAGRYTSGGRGTATEPTTVFEVTNLNDDLNPGSLRYALTQPATYRTVVFRVSGTIHLLTPLKLQKPNTTLAGQTAPGDGICLADQPFTVAADNVIVRFLRFRLGDKNQNLGPVNGSGDGDAFNAVGRSKLMIDHCSMSWSADEACSLYAGDSISLQWNLISEPLDYSYHFETGDTDFERHAYGGIWGGRHASFHHNLLAHCRGRLPRFDGSRNLSPNTPGQENAELVNNVLYNWASYTTNGGEGGRYNIINNYYKAGPSTSTGSSAGVPVRYQIINPYKSSSLPYGTYYLSGNYVEGSASISAHNWRGASMNGGSLNDTTLAKTTSSLTALVAAQPAQQAYEAVLAGAGAVLPARDAHDQRIVQDVRNRTGSLIDVQGGFPHGTPYAQTTGAWPTLNSLPAPADADHDGMPDAWETARGLNPNNPADRSQRVSNGYTQLENYLNGLAAPVLSSPALRPSETGLLVYPNPSQGDALQVQHPAAGPGAQLAVYNVLGQQVAAVPVVVAARQTRLALPKLAAGRYVLRFLDGGQHLQAAFEQP
ncbi:T9SS type A sorting domain-containing protein [Hymenobacter pini]|uniref:T9SS type A sorting domain-containing protein n=1 Tax=Hymenobacter pini TaxID=2880879 RepID=UPI001CF17ACB|nr:T9SS type A sorting domain-containing protein [Hymenobacter pini]MCA8833393.1 T9SS type A sorting domain-containing protein [Hymenobacter pini]